MSSTNRGAARRIIEGHHIIASVSGGKDSAALSLWLTEQGIEHERVFADTGWEAPETYDYLRGPLTDAIGPITEVRPERTMVDLVRHKAMFPSRVRRFCTESLKVEPLNAYHRQRAADTGLPVVQAVGIRGAESARRAALLEWDAWTAKDGLCVTVWRPLLAWSEQDVIDIHRRHGLAPNPLYLAGASRVGCWPCIYARKAEIRLIADKDPARIDQIAALEAEITEAADARAAAKGETNEHPRTWFAGRGPGAMGGRAGAMPVRDVVEWARTGKGGRQFELFDSTDPDAGCVRWGLCEHGGDDA